MNRKNTKNTNRGISLIELIIVIAIMGVLTGVIAPMFLKYVDKSRKSKDIYTADQIARAANIAFVENPEAYEAFQNWSGLRYTVSATYEGKTESYPVYLVAANDISYGYASYCFKGQGNAALGDRDGKTKFYGAINRELGLSTTEYNSQIVPVYKARRTEGNVKRNDGKIYTHEEVDRWRICKRVDTGMMEIWVAQPNPHGGYPVYRLWPEPDDEYRK